MLALYYDQRSIASAMPIPASTMMISASQPSKPSHAGASDEPPRLTHVRQIANVVAPPSVSSQQSPHTGARQRAHGPTAVFSQSLQRATGPSPLEISDVIACAAWSRSPTRAASPSLRRQKRRTSRDRA